MEFINLSIDTKNLENSFKRIAEDLLNQYMLISGKKSFRICEIEFYYTGINHDDKYTHGHELQKTLGQWYQHGSGLDITCGNEDYYGGILIRALQAVDKQGKELDYIYGPLKCLQALMSGFKSIEKHQVTFGLEKSNQGTLSLEKVLSAPRAGLNPTRDQEMYSKPYRFFIYPKKQHHLKGEIISSLRGHIADDELKEMFGWKVLPDKT
ncbi:hypothetical protein MM239_16990 [Belliella sp. DSM 111904]|uniref:Uncharacterized protein n=1 Tax=Belliella filtrata TaxID=2923435 RepID=A0ABS9V3W6_9BACT|nr:hypothetical protein [Belliella filtrata]MCH7411104.1 hypothetical protein [Belliella filtrata]